MTSAAPPLTERLFAALESEDALNNPTQTNAVLEQILLLDAYHVGALKMSGQILMRQGNLAVAQQRLERAVELDPQCPAAHSNLGRVRFEQGDIEDALADFKAAGKKCNGGDHAEVYKNEGLCFLKLGHRAAKHPHKASEALEHYSAAEKALDAARKMRPQDTRIPTLYAESAHALADIIETEFLFLEEEIALLGQVMESLGRVELNQNFARMVQAADEKRTKQKNQTKINKSVKELRLSAGKAAEFVQGIDKNNVSTMISLGCAALSLHTGAWEASQRLFERAIELDENREFRSPHYFLAQIYLHRAQEQEKQGKLTWNDGGENSALELCMKAQSAAVKAAGVDNHFTVNSDDNEKIKHLAGRLATEIKTYKEELGQKIAARPDNAPTM